MPRLLKKTPLSICWR